MRRQRIRHRAITSKALQVFWAPCLSAGLCLLVAPPFHAEWLIWVAFAPLFYWLMQGRCSVRQAAIGCAAVGWTYYLGISWPLLSLTWWAWGTASVSDYGLFLWRQTFLVGLVMVVLTGWGALLWSLCGALVRRCVATPQRAVVVIPCLWVALVEGFGHWAMGGMSWGMLGYHAHGLSAVRPLAGITGASGVSFLMILTNALVACTALAWVSRPTSASRTTPGRMRALAGSHRVALELISKPRFAQGSGFGAQGHSSLLPSARSPQPTATGVLKQLLGSALAGLTALVVGVTIGWARDGSFARPSPGTRLAAAILQGNVTMTRDEDFSLEHLDGTYGPMLQQALSSGASLIVLPETVWFKTLRLDEIPARQPVTGSFIQVPALTSALRRQMGTHDAVIVLGIDSLADGRVHNAVTVWANDGFHGAYFKRVLVPFAEFRPRGLAWLTPANQLHNSEFTYAPGTGPQLVRNRDLWIGAFICQEVLFPELIRASVKEGANLLVTAGNDGAFASPWVAQTMAAMAQFRAAESGRYLLRGMKSGVSAIIDPFGREMASAPVNTRALVQGMVALQSAQTPYVRWGDWFLWCCGVVAAWLLGASFRAPRRAAAGFTLVEVLVASVIASVIAGGTMMAFVTAARINRTQSNPDMAEASGYAQQTVERFRNLVANDAAWAGWITTNADGAWHTDALPPPGSGGTESILDKGPKRCYRVTAEDVDGVAGTDAYAVSAKVCWKDLTGCPCL